MILVIMVCFLGQCDTITRPATELECAMPWLAMQEVADERNAGAEIIIRCKR